VSEPPDKSAAPANHYATSQSLLVRVKKQDEEAWKRLIYIFSPLVYHVCKRWHVSGPDAEDVLQEVFQAVAVDIHHYQSERDGARASFRSWLSGIIQHKLSDWRRRQNRHVPAEGGSGAYARLQEWPEPELSEPDVALPADDLTATNGVCQRALHMLRDEFESQTWQAFWRTAVDGQTAVAVAAELGMQPAAVRKAKSRVLHRLKLEIGELVD
jgi:RNA polymerase sigma-70 factor (ECF subfamily)